MNERHEQRVCCRADPKGATVSSRGVCISPRWRASSGIRLRSGTRGIASRAMKNAVYIGETGRTASRLDAREQRVPAAVLLALISPAINLCAGPRYICREASSRWVKNDAVTRDPRSFCRRFSLHGHVANVFASAMAARG